MPAVNINLLPVELSAKSGVAKVAALFKRISTTGLIVFLGLGSLAGAFIVFFSIQINNTNQTNDTLKAQISALEIAEQKNVLVKDRLAKIKVINTQSDILLTTDKVKNVVATLPAGVNLSEANIDVLGKADFGFEIKDTSVLVNFLANLVVRADFKTLAIKNFSFSPVSGYKLSLQASNK